MAKSAERVALAKVRLEAIVAQGKADDARLAARDKRAEAKRISEKMKRK